MDWEKAYSNHTQRIYKALSKLNSEKLNKLSNQKLGKSCKRTFYQRGRQNFVVQSLSRVRLFATTWAAARLPCLSLSPRACSNSCPLSQWCHPAISSYVTLFSSCPQSFPASGSFPMNWFFASLRLIQDTGCWGLVHWDDPER